MAFVGARRVTMATLAASGDPLARWSFSGRGTDVHAVYERMRARGPLYRSPTGLRAVTGHAVCTQVLRDPGIGVRLPGSMDFRIDPLATDYSATLSRSFLTLDDPDHARLRRVAAPGFRPARVRAWQPRLEALADDLAQRAAATARREGSVDLVGAFAAPFPIAVVAELLGVHGADARRFAAIGALVGRGLDGVRTPGQAAAIRAGGAELEVMFTRLLADRAEEPRDDVLSLVAAARARGEADTADALGVAGLLLLAGFETTVNLVGNAVAALHGRPGLWAELVADPDLAPAVVEEALRHSTSVQATARVAHVDTEVAGRALPAGSVVLVMLAAANRDPDVYARPAVFDPHRTGEADHLAFSSGEHYCLGAALARLEAQVALRALAAAMPGMALAPGSPPPPRAGAARLRAPAGGGLSAPLSRRPVPTAGRRPRRSAGAPAGSGPR